MDTSKFIECNTKGGIDYCHNHQNYLKLQNNISILISQILSQPSQQQLDLYVDLVEKRDKVLAVIGVSEYDDLTIATENIDSSLIDEMKLLLTKRIDKQPIDNIDWTAYVKAAIAFTNPQSYGSKIETMYLRKIGYEKVKSNDEQGDARDPNTNKYFEFKFSVMSYPKYQIDLVQIRPHHILDEYHIVAFNTSVEITEFYILSKEDMEKELEITGAKLAHGTNKSKEKLSHPEYAIRLKKNSKDYQRWQQYRKPVNWK